jgi:predicted metal-dependent hydrolase
VPDLDDLSHSCVLVGLPFTLRYLEPYLIRTMRAAGNEATDTDIASGMRAFSMQEAHHHRNHTRMNDVVRAKLALATSVTVQDLEDRLQADYRRFSTTKSLRFNLAYAEGFEAMTLALALTLLSSATDGVDETWKSLIEWHLAEEIEHRTVRFDAYDHIIGTYWYRSARGLWAQRHFLSYLIRLAAVIETELRGSRVRPATAMAKAVVRLSRMGFLRHYVKTLSPRYNPAHTATPPMVTALLEKYDELAA